MSSRTAVAAPVVVAPPHPLETRDDIVAWVDEYRGQGYPAQEAFEQVARAIETEGRAGAFLAAAGTARLVSHIWRLAGADHKRHTFAAAEEPEPEPLDPEPSLPNRAGPNAPRHDWALLQSEESVRPLSMFDVRYWVGRDYVLLGDLDHETGQALVTKLCKVAATYRWESRFITALTAALPAGKRVRDCYTEAEIKRIKRETRGDG